MKTLLTLILLTAAPVVAVDKLVPVDDAGFPKLVASHKGKIVLVDFWATWCEPCRKEMPELVKVQAKYKAKGLVVLTISADEPEQEAGAKTFLTRNGVADPVYVRRVKDEDKFINGIDPKWSGALPALFLYDRTGKKVRSFIGETPMADVEAAIAKLR